MSERKFSPFYRWLLLSLLAHLLIAALVLQQQPKAAARPQKPVPIVVFAANRSTASALAETATVKTKAVTTPAPLEKPQPATKPVQPKRQAAVAGPTSKAPRQRQSAKPTPATAASAAVVAAPAEQKAITTDISALLDSVAARTAQRELSAAEIAELTAPKADLTARPNSASRRPAVKPGSGPAADVLETLPDGSQLVRAGKDCVLATPGADLRKDIHSMKVVGCGAGGRTEQDRIDAHFEQVMSKVGQHR